MLLFGFFSDIGADIVDVTNQESLKFGKFRLENTWFELDPAQQRYFEQFGRLNTHLREQYHALRDILWRSGYTSYFQDMPARYFESYYHFSPLLMIIVVP